MRIATWNINSVRLRLNLVERFLELANPDVLCLQETKTPNEFFPASSLMKMGYKFHHIQGMKSYNGVAIISRLPLTDLGIKNWFNREDCRHIFANLPNGIELHCCYVPAGGDIPDPDINPKFAHKLGFLDEQIKWWGEKKKNRSNSILLGDLNIAPLENDVWSHKQMNNVVSHTQIEIEKLTSWQNTNSFYDAGRHKISKDEKLYSWWSYRSHDWNKSNRGRRLDHIWVSPKLIPSLKRSDTFREIRGWEPKPSDHVPVMIEIG